jgi:nucleoside-diphosphate-sugar epimerase
MIAVTGANGYLGRRVISYLRAAGGEPIALVRRPQASGRSFAAGQPARRYALAEPLEPSLLEGIETVVHAAWDLSARGEEIRTVNVCGSLPLLEELAARGGRAVLISSLAAFAGARSLYGRAKLALEREVLERGGAVIRPGVVFGVDAGGLFGALVAAVSGAPFAPLIGGGWQRLFVTHDERLCELIAAITSGRFAPQGPVFAAHELPTTLRAIAVQLAQADAQAEGRRLRVLPVPERLAYLGLRSAELAGLSLSFRSDSLLSLANPIPLDLVAALERSPVAFPALSEELWRPQRREPSSFA